jgi:hypothetical protein
MTRDELARHLYIRGYGAAHPFDQWDRDFAERVWDDNEALVPDMDDCFARADQMIRDGQVPS